MSKKDEPVIEIQNDYGIINRYADNVLDYHKDLLNFRQSKRIFQMFKGFAIICLAIGIAIFLYFLGLSLLEWSKNTKSEKEIIEQIIVKEEEQKIIEAEGATIKTDYTIFSTISLSNFEVVTGWTYDPNTPDMPKYEYCYHSIPNRNGQKLTTDLARKFEGRSIRWELNIDEELRQIAKKYCKFR